MLVPVTIEGAAVMVKSQFANLSEVRLHYRDEGEGEVVVLLHGWPQTSYAWRHVIPILSPDWRVIVPDLRGMGDSSRPLDGFDAAALAGDILELLDRLGVKVFSLVGHGRGGLVGFAMALLARNRIVQLALIDAVLPGDGSSTGQRSGASAWHEAFHRMPNLPEALVAGREALYLGWFFEEFSVRGGAVRPVDLAEYVRCYAQPGAMRCGFEYDRTFDVSAAFVRSQLAWEGKISIPVLSVSGGAGRGKAGDAEASINPLVDHLEAHTIPDCGHLVPEEAPEELCGILRPFLSDGG